MQRATRAVLLGVAFLTAAACTHHVGRHEKPQGDAVLAGDSLSLPPTAPPPAWGQMRWLAAGGGPTPDMNQISIEQDIGLAAGVLGGPGRILYEAGAGSRDVQVLDPEQRGSPLLLSLGDLFAPRAGRDSSYRRTSLHASGAASADDLLDALQRLVDTPGPPVTVFIAGHGDMGQKRRDNEVQLWAQSELRVSDIADVIDHGKTQRALHFVITSCYGGGFAELAFRDADSQRGEPAPTPRCGFFATTYDLPAAGCDPNPDRGAQEDYALYFFNALRGCDRHGKPLPRATLDLDGDGRISLLEAHTWARIASKSADVPTTTSERWLRQMAPLHGKSEPVHLPEEAAVVRALARRLGVAGRLPAAKRELDALNVKLAGIADRRSDAQDAEDDAYRRAAAELLARWPVLDDPWHPDFAPTLREHQAAIATALAHSAAYATYRKDEDRVDALDDAYWRLRRRAAPYQRLVRAIQTQRLAGRLKAVGGKAWRTYQALLACERSVPVVHGGRAAARSSERHSTSSRAR